VGEGWPERGELLIRVATHEQCVARTELSEPILRVGAIGVAEEGGDVSAADDAVESNEDLFDDLSHQTASPPTGYQASRDQMTSPRDR